MSSAETVALFVSAINRRSIDDMIAMMTPDHLFVDSMGREILGRLAMREAWLEYFRLIDGYRIEVEEVFEKGTRVVVIGRAHGICWTEDGDARWSVPAAWQAITERDRIREWRVFADSHPLYELMSEASR